MKTNHRIRLTTACGCERLLKQVFEEPPRLKHRIWLVDLPVKVIPRMAEEGFYPHESISQRREFEAQTNYEVGYMDENTRIVIWDYREVVR